MGKAFFWLVCVLALIAGSYAAGKAWRERQSVCAKIEEAFKPTRFPANRRPFAIVIVGFNNGAFVEKAIASAASQVYEPYRIIYIDDASTDGSYAAACDQLRNLGKWEQTTTLRNPERLGMAVSLAHAAENCRSEEILVLLDGQDWLAHEWVLQRLNEYYADDDLWLTYSRSCLYPSYQRAEPEIEVLQACYASLLKRKEAAPLQELARGHTQNIPEVLYITNLKAQREKE